MSNLQNLYQLFGFTFHPYGQQIWDFTAPTLSRGGRGHDEPMFKAVTTVCHLISCEQKGDLSEGDQQLLF